MVKQVQVAYPLVQGFLFVIGKNINCFVSLYLIDRAEVLALTRGTRASLNHTGLPRHRISNLVFILEVLGLMNHALIVCRPAHCADLIKLEDWLLDVACEDTILHQLV